MIMSASIASDQLSKAPPPNLCFTLSFKHDVHRLCCKTGAYNMVQGHVTSWVGLPTEECNPSFFPDHPYTAEVTESPAGMWVGMLFVTFTVGLAIAVGTCLYSRLRPRQGLQPPTATVNLPLALDLDYAWVEQVATGVATIDAVKPLANSSMIVAPVPGQDNGGGPSSAKDDQLIDIAKASISVSNVSTLSGMVIVSQAQPETGLAL